MENNSRRDFLKKSLLTGAAIITLPQFLKSSSLSGRSYAKGSANKLIQFAQIGCGREGTVDYEGTMRHTDLCRMVAVCDLDSKRVDIAKNTVETFYKGKGETNVTVKHIMIFMSFLQILISMQLLSVFLIISMRMLQLMQFLPVRMFIARSH